MKKETVVPPPNWASWIENWCGRWHLKTDDRIQLEIGVLVVKFPDGTLHPGIVCPPAGQMVAGGIGFRATDERDEGGRIRKCLEIVQPIGGACGPHHGMDGPTEGEVYEEDDEFP